MVTGIAEVTQDPEKAGNALKVLSLRLRGMKGQLEELGEETDENVENISKMQGQILNMTKGKVNIFDGAGNFKSTYEIMKGIAEVWEDLSSIDQANLLETIAGKHRANDVAALLSNWQNVEAAVKSASEAEGSAARENAKYVDSLQGRLDKLTTAWQSFANTFMESDFLKGAVSALTKVVEIIEGLVDNVGTLGTIGIGAGIFGIFKNRSLFSGILKDFGTFGSLIPDAIRSSETLGGKLKNLGSIAGQTGGSIAGKLAGSLSATVGVIGLVVAAVGLAINAYKNYKEEQSRLRQETIRTSDEFLDAAGSFEQAYIKYSGRTDLTAEEEAELETAINGTTEALNDKSSALQNVVNSSNDYVSSLEQIAREEIKAAARAAKAKRENAAAELEEAAIGWESFDGSEVDIGLSSDGQIAKFTAGIDSEFINAFETSDRFGHTTQHAYIQLSGEADADEIVRYYDFLLDYQERLSDAKDEGLIDADKYEEAYGQVSEVIDKLSESVSVYTEGVYEAAKAEYQLAYGIPTTTEAYLRMRESILGDMGDMSVDTRKNIAGSLDTEYGGYFDLTSSNAQSRKLIGILDEYGDEEANQVETFLNMRTKVNDNECSVGDYLSQFDDINKMSEDWDDKSKEELNASFGLDTDTIKQQYDEIVKYYARTKTKKAITGVLDHDRQAYEGILSDAEKSKEEIGRFLDSLSASELAAVVNLKTELDWESDNFDEILAQIQEEAALIEAISFSVNIELEAEKLENLTTAISESVSGAGLSTESISLVEDMFGDLDGYDKSALFERTANGIRLNSDELRKLNDEYKKTNVDGLDGKIDALGERYNQTKEELYNLTYGTDEYNKKARELSDIEAQIHAAEKLAAQYSGLASAYQEWQRVESAGSQRDMYEGMIEGFETVGDEISRGWLDDGTIEFLELIRGEKATIIDGDGTKKEVDIATASVKELKQVWKDLDKNIEHTSYSVRDFFTVDEDGNSTSQGVYNFLDAIGQMEEEEFGGKDVVKRNDKGEIIAFDFQIAGGDKAIAEALGISEELVQIMKRAADDAGFVVSMDGTYQQLDVLKKKAAEAAQKLKETFKVTEYSFFQDGSEKGIKKDYDEALKVWETFKKNKKEDGTIDMSVKGAEEAYTLVSTLQSMVDQLSEPVYMELNASQVEKDMQTPLSKLQEYETLVQTEHQLQLKGTDTSQIEADKEAIIDYFDELQENSPEIAAELGIEGLSREEIQAKVESGEIEIPATIDLQVEMNNTLRDMVNVALYNAGLIDKEELETRVDIKLYADKIDTSDVEEKTEDAVEDSDGDIEREQNIKVIAETFGIENVDDLTSKLKGLDDKTIQAIAEVLGRTDVDSLKYTLDNLGAEDKLQLQVIAEALGKGDVESLQTAIDNLSPNTVEAIAKALGYSDVESLKSAVASMDGNTVQAIAQALGLSDVNTLQITINNMQGNTVDAGVNTDGQAGKIDTLQGKIDGMRGNTVTITTVMKTVYEGAKKAVKKGAAAGKKLREKRFGTVDASGANGTANVNGTTGKAFKQGSWGTKTSGTALVGELGREVLIRDGRYYTIGDTGAEFIKYRRGDIILNHVQSEQLFRNGKVTADGGRAKAFVNGTAFLSGTAFDEGTPTGYSSPDGESYNAGSSNAEDKFEDVIDWIETILDRAERAIDKYEQQAGNVYKTWSKRNAALENEIAEVDSAIGLYKNARDKYLSEANSVGLDETYAKKVRNGSISVEDFEGKSDEALVEKIKNYQDLYEKYLDCVDKIDELKEKEASLYSQRFDHVSEEYNNLLQGFDHTESMLNEYVNQAEEKGYIVSKNYYNALIDNEEARISKLQEEQSALIEARDDAVANGEFDKYSEDWYRMCQEIDSVTQAIESGATALIEYDNAMRDIDWEIFDTIQERISDVTAEADFLIDLMSNKELFDDKGQLTSQGMATMGLHGQNYNTYMYQADDYGAKVQEIDKKIASGELDGYDKNVIERRREYLELQRESILAAEDEKNAIRDMVEEGINLELDALQELIDKKNEELESERDLYEYQKKVKEQTEEIASLEKQMAAYSGDDSEEAKAKVQQLEIDLETAKEDLKETEWDKVISDTSALLDNLYLEAETLLNTRLDNVDALLEQMIAEINLAAGAEGTIATALGAEGALATAIGNNATTIKATLETEAKNVGTTLSEAMSNIWNVGEGNAKSVLTTYGNNFQNKQTTTNTVLNDIKADIDRMVDDVDKDAQKKVASNKTSSSSKKNPTTTKTTTTNKAPTTSKGSSGGDGKPKVGDKVKFISGKYYYDSQGKKPLGSKYQGKEVYITRINTKSWATHPYHISTGNKLGKGDLGWLKLNQLSGYATGKKNFLEDELAWTQENGLEEYIVRPSDGAILTPVARKGSVLNAQASENLWNMTNSPAEFIKDNLNLGSANVPNNQNVQSNYTQHFDKVVFNLPNVKNYDELLAEMQKDKNFERLISAMTIDRLAGKSSLAKGKAIR